MPHPVFDRSRLRLRPLFERVHDFTHAQVIPLERPAPAFDDPQIEALSVRIRAARQTGAPVILSMGAHVLKVGLSLYVADLVRQGWVTALALNGACVIHDFEMALIGATTESVAHYIQQGQFGLWTDTGRINALAGEAAAEGIGLGERVGREIATGDFPYRHLSILAAAYESQVPATVHVGIGYDIIHEHPNCDGAALGAASYHDFLVFAEVVRHLEGGVFLNYGTAIMGPEVYLKALSMARNVAHQEGKEIRHFTTAVFDLIDLGNRLDTEAPKSDPKYYYRPFKTVLVRTVADGGESFYIRGDHTATLPNLWRLLTRQA
ncbi:MAG TPA: hypothetical protein PLD23_06120 [Armatimonadota bacterium]|nr:hypothetical protein [Armatimonadota bacterium]HQK93059.1 hypothetical protein [Armatimonadota bacterium]